MCFGDLRVKGQCERFIESDLVKRAMPNHRLVSSGNGRSIVLSRVQHQRPTWAMATRAVLRRESNEPEVEFTSDAVSQQFRVKNIDSINDDNWFESKCNSIINPFFDRRTLYRQIADHFQSFRWPVVRLGGVDVQVMITSKHSNSLLHRYGH